MGDTHISGRDGGRDGGRDSGHGGRRSGKHDGGRNGGRNGKRKGRRNGASREQQNEGGEANGPPNEPDVEEEITLPGDPTIPFLANQQMRNGERYSTFEGGLGNGYSYAGQNEFILGNGGRENARSYNEPMAGAQQQGNNGLAPGGQLAGLDDLDRYSPLGTWAGDVSRGYNAWTDRFLDSGPNGGPPARNA
ncbi:hypothetical protein VE01_04854 [Pseudogymnoascus verrucosus]|uniref:Uncharacterized protein n=1 Tax=Pseudogymnoascus verrucosus TaxID=342668 RepID=A0A1B8GMK0_9PEZI|nr:uncharacterized protein VE01_04854 [Pseudogymnoascus verrucosus]OBT97065.1 hypothetical protein VE01_04854 [Pseudogymnoascus verrucosus]